MKKNILVENKTTIPVYCLLILITLLAFPPIGVLVAFVFICLIVISNRKESILKSIGFVPPESWKKTVLVSLCLGILIELSFQIFFNDIFEYITNSKIDVSGFDSVRGDVAGYMIMLSVGWVIGGFIEEITFRGYLITRLIKVFGGSRFVVPLIILSTSILFGISHMYQGWSGVLSTGTISLIFGIIFIKSRLNMWYPILIHGFVNTTGFTLIYLNCDTILQNIW